VYVKLQGFKSRLNYLPKIFTAAQTAVMGLMQELFVSVAHVMQDLTFS